MMNQNFKKAFDNKKIKIDELMAQLTVNGGMGYLVLHADNANDVVSSYSVNEYEFLNPGFKAVLDKYAAYVPDSLPLVLEITGCDFTEQEKKQIQNAIWHEYEYDYLSENQGMRKTLLHAASSLLFALFFLSYLYFWKPQGLVVDLIWVPLWAFLDSVLALFLYDLPGSRKLRRRYVQKQTAKLLFTKEYNADDPTHEEVRQYQNVILRNTRDEQV